MPTDDLMTAPATGPRRVKKTRRSASIVLEAEDGTEETFVAYEMTGPTRNDFRAEMARRYRTGPDGKQTITDFKNLEASLITRSLTFRDRPVPVEMVNSWSATVVDEMFKLCEEVNAMGATAEESVKND